MSNMVKEKDKTGENKAAIALYFAQMGDPIAQG